MNVFQAVFSTHRPDWGRTRREAELLKPINFSFSVDSISTTRISTTRIFLSPYHFWLCFFLFPFASRKLYTGCLWMKMTIVLLPLPPPYILLLAWLSSLWATDLNEISAVLQISVSGLWGMNLPTELYLQPQDPCVQLSQRHLKFIMTVARDAPLAALLVDLGSISSTHMAAHNCL